MEAIRGALAFLAVREGITVLQLSDATEQPPCCGLWRGTHRSVSASQSA
jgi:hypothetical protein